MAKKLYRCVARPGEYWRQSSTDGGVTWVDECWDMRFGVIDKSIRDLMSHQKVIERGLTKHGDRVVMEYLDA